MSEHTSRSTFSVLTQGTSVLKHDNESESRAQIHTNPGKISPLRDEFIFNAYIRVNLDAPTFIDGGKWRFRGRVLAKGEIVGKGPVMSISNITTWMFANRNSIKLNNSISYQYVNSKSGASGTWKLEGNTSLSIENIMGDYDQEARSGGDKAIISKGWNQVMTISGIVYSFPSSTALGTTTPDTLAASSFNLKSAFVHTNPPYITGDTGYKYETENGIHSRFINVEWRPISITYFKSANASESNIKEVKPKFVGYNLGSLGSVPSGGSAKFEKNYTRKFIDNIGNGSKSQSYTSSQTVKYVDGVWKQWLPSSYSSPYGNGTWNEPLSLPAYIYSNLYFGPQYRAEEGEWSIPSAKSSPSGGSAYGYKFKGWYGADGYSTPTGIITQSDEYYGWYTPDKYRLEFDINNKTISSRSAAKWWDDYERNLVFSSGEPNTKYYGAFDTPDATMVKGNTSKSLVNREPLAWGYSFEGWNTKADGTGYRVAKGGSIGPEFEKWLANNKVSLTSTIKLYAIWKPINDTIICNYYDKAGNLKSVITTKNIESTDLNIYMPDGINLGDPDYTIYGWSGIVEDTHPTGKKFNYNDFTVGSNNYKNRYDNNKGFFKNPMEIIWTNKYPYYLNYIMNKINVFKKGDSSKGINPNDFSIPWGKTINLYACTTVSGKYVFINGKWEKALCAFVYKDGAWEFIDHFETKINGTIKKEVGN